MESMYVWLFLFAGGTIAFLAMLLLGSERELKKKRRELQEILRNRSDSAGQLSSDPQGPHSSAQNQELLDKISLLSSQLEESQGEVNKLQAEQQRLVEAHSANRQLEETVANLRSELQASENRLSESSTQAQQVVDRNAQLQTELDELERRHQASQTTITELQAGQERIGLDAQSEKQKLSAENQRLEQEIAGLRNQIQASETQLGAHANQNKELTERHGQLQLQINELKQQIDHLSEEKNSLSTKFADAQRTLEDLQTTHGSTRSENQHLQAANQELQGKITKLNGELQTSESRLSESAREAQDGAERYAKLQREATELKEQLQSSQRTIEELRAEQERLAKVQSENQKLRQESTELREQLERNEAQLTGLSRQNQEAADHYARLKGEAAILARQVDEMQPKIRELEAVKQDLANAESRERILISRQDDQEGQMASLRRDLSTAEARVQELDAARSRMAEIERRCEELRNDNRRLEDELSRSQERRDRSVENQRQIDLLQRQRDESPMRPAPFLDLNDEMPGLSPSESDLTHILQSTTDAGGQLAREVTASVGANPIERAPSAMALSHATSLSHEPGETHQAPLLGDDVEADMAMENGLASAASDQSWHRKRSQLARISAIVALAVVAGGGVGVVATKYFLAKDDTVEREFVSDERVETASQTAETKPGARVQGKFKITRATEVYSGPTEKSALITRIEPGIKINVVDSRDGWLEIRSKHGRPPGFVREEAAVKIDQN